MMHTSRPQPYSGVSKILLVLQVTSTSTSSKLEVAATSSNSGQAVAIELILSDHPFWVYSLTLITT